MMNRHMSLVVISLPCIALAAISTWWMIGRAAGGGLWPPDQVTLAEAVATRNNAEALRLIARGANPNERQRLRDGQPQRDVHRAAEREQLDRNESLVVVARDDGIELAAYGAPEDRVARKRPVNGDTTRARRLD